MRRLHLPTKTQIVTYPMKTTNRSFPELTVLAVSLILCKIITLADVVTFTIDPNQSPLSVSGSLSGVTGNEQGPGSLSTQFTGTIQVDLQSSSIQFIGNSSITLQENGSWQPAPGGTPGSAPASLAGVAQNFLATAHGALRNVLVDLTSEPLNLDNESFNAQTLLFSIPPDATSAADYRVTGLLNASGSQLLAGQGTNGVVNTATLTTQDTTLTLTLPINFSGTTTVVSPNDLSYSAQGQILATTTTKPLEVADFVVSPGQLQFNMPTTPGKSYSILSSQDLLDWSTVLHQFTATSNSEAIQIALDLFPKQFFRIRQDN